MAASHFHPNDAYMAHEPKMAQDSETKGEILVQLDMLNAAASELSMTLGHLIGRLAPVSRSEPDSDTKGEASGHRLPSTKVGQEIRSVTYELERMHARAAAALNRLELP